MREQMLASISGRDSPRSQRTRYAPGTARISQIENGDAVTIEVLRVHLTCLDGQVEVEVEVAARIGDIRLNVA